MENQIPHTPGEPRVIQELPSDVVDQIAAGEVVERPAHLVKELIENAVDAGASEIEIEFDHGGRSVRVTDNGSGIRAEDLSRALARHATSKIKTADDLWTLTSFGFRGEALASIGAVSRLEIISRPHSEATAARVKSEFGRLESVAPIAGNPGTTIIVNDLFENVPARLKFMKSEAAEGAQIRLVVKAAAMGAPRIGFRLRSKGKTEFVLKSDDDFLTRARAVFSLVSGVVPLHSTQGEFEGLKAEIAFSGPQDVIGNSKGLWFFVQNRWIQDRSLQAAVLESYRGLLMHGEYPYAVVKLSVPDGEVDVNIHPTKSAVKFREPSRAFRAVSRTLREALEKAPWIQDAPSREYSSAAAVSRGSMTASSMTAMPARAEVLTVNDFTRPYLPSDSPTKSFFDGTEAVQLKKKEFTSKISEPPSDSAPQVSKGVWSRLQILGQADLTYLVCQDDDRLVFVDQHAAHERVAFERLMKAWKNKSESGTMETQSLLFPIVVELEPELVEALLPSASDLLRIGLSIERLGPSALAVSSIPVILKSEVIGRSLKEFAQALLDRGGGHVLEERIGDVFARLACHSVVRAGQTLSHQEMRELLEQMDEFPLSSFCPHGRPVSVEYPFSRLERDFGRIG